MRAMASTLAWTPEPNSRRLMPSISWGRYWLLRQVRSSRVNAPIVIEIWVHFQGAESSESPRLAVRIAPRYGGLRATPLR